MSLTPSNQNLKIGQKVPDFALPSTENLDVSLQSLLEGKKGALVVFMCNHCPYVIPKIDTLIKIQKQFPQVCVVGINSNDPTDYPQDSFENMQKEFRERGFNFPYLFDQTQAVAEAWYAVCTPDPFLIDAEQKLIAHGRFDPEHKEASDGREMIQAIQLFLDGKEIPKLEPSMGCSIKWKPEHYSL